MHKIIYYIFDGPFQWLSFLCAVLIIVIPYASYHIAEYNLYYKPRHKIRSWKNYWKERNEIMEREDDFDH